MSSRRRAERTRLRPYVMIWAMAAFDLLVTPLAPVRLPDFKNGVTAFQSALFFAIVMVRNIQRSTAIAVPRASIKTIGYMNAPPFWKKVTMLEYIAISTHSFPF